MLSMGKMIVYLDLHHLVVIVFLPGLHPILYRIPMLNYIFPESFRFSTGLLPHNQYLLIRGTFGFCSHTLFPKFGGPFMQRIIITERIFPKDKSLSTPPNIIFIRWRRSKIFLIWQHSLNRLGSHKLLALFFFFVYFELLEFIIWLICAWDQLSGIIFL